MCSKSQCSQYRRGVYYFANSWKLNLHFENNQTYCTGSFSRLWLDSNDGPWKSFILLPFRLSNTCRDAPELPEAGCSLAYLRSPLSSKPLLPSSGLQQMMDGAVSLQVAVASVAPRSPPPPCRSWRERGWISDPARVLSSTRGLSCTPRFLSFFSQ